MTKRTPDEVYSILQQAGFTAAQAVTMTAIAGAESGYDDASVGDVGLQTAEWGPSFGLFQVRTLKGETGKGTVRDIQSLAGDDLAQAKAAYAISHQGRDFSPWSVYTNGRYQQFLGAARDLAGKVGSAIGLATPVGLTSGVTKNVRSIAVEGGATIAALAILVLGFVRFVQPVTTAIQRTAAKVV